MIGLRLFSLTELGMGSIETYKDEKLRFLDQLQHGMDEPESRCC